MRTIRWWAGVVGGVFLLLSSVAHGVLGGAALREELGAAAVPAELQEAVGLGWSLGSVAMAVFGLVGLATFGRWLRGGRPDPLPARLVGGAYILYGLWAWASSGWEPFFLNFPVTGLLVLQAALAPPPEA